MHVSDLLSLKGKCAVVIGGAGKIGLPIAEGLAEAGARVYICSRHEKNYADAAKRLTALGLDAHGLRLDQEDEKSVNDALAQVTRESKCPDILVNSGVERPMSKFMNDSVENWDRSMMVNSRGLFVPCRAFARAMVQSGQGGSIINIASIYGIVAPDFSIYAGSSIQTPPDYPYNKGGMILFSKYLASYFANKYVRVNCIAPGGFFNDQEETFLNQYVRKVPMGRMAFPDDLKGVAVFLASNASQYVTGAVIPVDGGFTLV